MVSFLPTGEEGTDSNAFLVFVTTIVITMTQKTYGDAEGFLLLADESLDRHELN